MHHFLINYFFLILRDVIKRDNLLLKNGSVSVFIPGSHYYNYSAVTNFVFEEQKQTKYYSYTYEQNGRLYDPVICRFFSPDNFVQLPEFTQSFNRYSYCLNNPLKYTDPSGMLWVDDIWDFDQNGNSLNRTENKNFDQIRVLNNDGSVFAESKKYAYGFFENIMSFYKQSVLIAGEKHDLEGLSMNFGENVKGTMAAFKFLAKNTNPEWHALGRNNFKGGIDNLLTTTHKPDFEYFGLELAKQAAPDGGLFYDFHSHKTNLFPSNRTSNGRDSDMEIRLRLVGEGQSPSATFGILYKGVIYDYKGFPIKGY